MPRYRVLIVDDQKDIRRLLNTGLSILPEKIDVVDVPSAEEAMLVLRGSFDLMVSDIRLPGISGLDLFRRIHKQHPKMKIMLMTGLSDPEIRSEVEEAGAADFIYKPIELNEFQQKVRALLGILPQGKTPDAAIPQQAVSVNFLALVDRLENLRQKAFVGLAAVLDREGKVVAQAGFLQDVYIQTGLQKSLAHLLAANLELSECLESSSPECFSYVSGKKYHFYLASINPTHLLALTAEQSFQQKISQINQWLPDAVRDLDRDLAGDSAIRPISLANVAQNKVEPESSLRLSPGPVAPTESGGTAPAPAPSSEAKLEEEEISADDLAAVDALFESKDKKKLKTAELDQFWDSLAEEDNPQPSEDGSISYDDALDMGLAPD